MKSFLGSESQGRGDFVEQLFLTWTLPATLPLSLVFSVCSELQVGVWPPCPPRLSWPPWPFGPPSQAGPTWSSQAFRPPPLRVAHLPSAPPARPGAITLHWQALRALQCTLLALRDVWTAIQAFWHPGAMQHLSPSFRDQASPVSQTRAAAQYCRKASP